MRAARDAIVPSKLAHQDEKDVLNDVLRQSRGSRHLARKSIHDGLMAAIKHCKCFSVASLRARNQLGVGRFSRVNCHRSYD